MEIKRSFLKNPQYTKQTRRNLRNNPTSEEKLLWQYLKSRNLNGKKFRRQYGIGPYVVDFYCPEYNFIIELDGLIHLKEDNKKYDEERSCFLNENGFTLIRFTDEEINKNIVGALQKIESYLK
ncbi:endonuclease domain-containing protein [Saccharicrinis sp. FJH62]|uniref:endonuclease domain-containing protein n=1 Tax=Saccharicrinis sp. FJH62 TaxID=3344657 RepID=UPI0035D49EF1